MKKPEITPGPWYYVKDDSMSGVMEVVDDNGNEINFNILVACDLDGNDYTERRSNGQAISAVPEMLDALIEARDYVRECGYEGEEWEEILIKQIESALKKAGVDL